MSSSYDPTLPHKESRPFEELYELERIETIEFNDGIEYLIGTPFSEVTYYLENYYKDSITKHIRDNLKYLLKEEIKKELKEEIKKELKEEIKKELKEENNNH